MRRVTCVPIIVFALFTLTVLTGWAQERAGSARARELGNGILLVLERMEARSPGQDSDRAEGSELLVQRARALSALADEDPAAVLRLAFPSNLTTRLTRAFPAAASQLEVQGSWDGPLEYIVEDSADFSTHRNIRTIISGGERVTVHFAGPEPQGLKNGDLVRLTGVRVGSVLAVSDATIIAPALEGPLTCSTTGPQRSIVLLVTMPGAAAPENITTTNVSDTFFSPSTRSLSEYWRENSFGSTWAEGDVRGWFTLDRVYSCEESNAIRTAAIAAADADVDFTGYTRVFIIVNGMTGTCTWGGLGTLACGSLTSADGTFTASTSWIRPGYFDPDDLLRDGVQVAAHEGGHNLGLRHANSRDYGNVPLGAIGESGTVTEYGDLFSSMGRLRNNTFPEPWIGFGHYAAPHKLQLGWLTPVQSPTVTASGSFLVEPLETAGGTVQALKITRGTRKVRGVTTTHSIWVEFRQPLGNYDTTLYPQVFGGGLIHYEDSTNAGATHLLDFTPAGEIPEATNRPEVRDWSNPALAGTWNDPHTGISLTTSGATPNGLLVDVTFGPPVCVLSNPIVAITPPNPATLAGSNVTYTVTVTNTDAAACASRTFHLSSSLPSAWITQFSAASLTLAPQASASVSMTKSVPAGTALGTYDVNAIVTSADQANATSATAGCTVSPGLPPIVATIAPLGSFPTNTTISFLAFVLRTDSTPVVGASVLFTLTPPGGAPVTKTAVTDSAGRATWSYKIGPKAAVGTYTLRAVATLGGETATAPAEDFVVSP